MAGPITWQTIMGQSLAEASRPLEAAGRSFNAGFDQLGAVLAQREAIDAQNQVIQRNVNTQDFQDKIASQFKTPEALQAAIQSGAIDQLRAGYGGAIDRAAVRGAPEALLAQRFAQAQAANAYTDQATDRAEQPIRDNILSEIAQGRTGVAKELLAENQLRNKAALFSALDTRGQTEIDRQRGATEFDWKGQKIKDDLLTNQSQRNSAAQSILASQENIRASQAQREALNAQRERDVAARAQAGIAATNQANLKTLSDLGNPYAAEGVYTGKQAGDISKLMRDNAIGDSDGERAAIVRRFSSGTVKVKDPSGKEIEVPIPYAAFKAAILGAKDSNWNDWNEGWADNVEKNLKATLSSVSTVKDAQGNPVKGEGGKTLVRMNSLDDLAAFQDAIAKAQSTPVIPVTGKKKLLTR